MADYARKDIHFPRELSRELELLKKEVREKTGRRVTTSRLVVEIVNDFFEKSKKSSSSCFLEKTV